GSAGTFCSRMLVELSSPDLLAGVRVDRVGVALHVRKISGVSVGSSRALIRTNRDSSAYSRLRFVDPVGAACRCIERINDSSRIAAEKDPSTRNGNLRSRLRHACDAECPLDRKSTRLNSSHVSIS